MMGGRLDIVLLIAAICSSINASPTPFVTPSPTLMDRSLGGNGPIILTAAVTPKSATPLFTAKYENLEATKTIDKRGLGELGQSMSSALHKMGEDIQGFLTGVPLAFRDYPTGTQVENSLGVHGDRLAAVPTEVLNLPPYANWTNMGWNVRFHGNVYKMPNHTQKQLDDRAAAFLIGSHFRNLPENEKNNARNLTAEIFVVQQGDQIVQMDISVPNPSNSPNQGGVPATGGRQTVMLPYLTTPEGDFDDFVPISLNGITPGNATSIIQTLDVFAKGSKIGNATAYLVPPEGFTIINDIDDILRVTKIYLPKQGILNTFAKPFVPWLNMPDIYSKWASTIPNVHFHYLTTTPEQGTRPYMHFIFNTYPHGSFDTRPLNFSNIKETFHIRKFLLNKIFETFPKRKFILVADTSNGDIMKAYPEMALQHPDQVQCIFLRNTSATDRDYIPYDTSRFKNIDQKKYMFFVTPDDLSGVDLVGGNCYNRSVQQNLTFGRQDELLGWHHDKEKKNAAGSLRLGSVGGWIVWSLAMAVMFGIIC